MIQKLQQNRRGGFTLVEIMIVVAIIALLAAIAVPNFLRARKRSQATSILKELQMIDAAKDQYAIENNKTSAVTPDAEDLARYVKVGTPLYSRLADGSGNDLIGNAITISPIDTPPYINATTYANFSDVVEDDTFWGSYYKAAGN